jgi:hypothetical protein
MIDRNSAVSLLTLLTLAFTVTGCASSPPTVQTGPDAETTFDGLNKVNNSKADQAWARPDFDISGYSKIMLVQTGISYTPTTNRGRTETERSRGGPYFMDDRARARFESLVAAVFSEEMSKIERFTIVDQPGPDVLVVRGGLIDVSSFVPSQMTDPTTRIYLRSVGEATLVLELLDSETNTVLARSVDRRAAQRMGGAMQESHTVSNTAEVTRLIRFWATRLREGLDGFVE